MQILLASIILTLALTEAKASELPVSYEEIYSQVSSGDAILIDARTGVGLGTETIQGAHWIRFPEVTSQIHQVVQALADCLPQKKIYIFCHVGSWAGYFAEKLKDEGFETENLGRYSAWPSQYIPKIIIQKPAINDKCPYQDEL